MRVPECGFFPHVEFSDTSLVSYNQLKSGPVYLEFASGPTGLLSALDANGESSLFVCL